MSAAVEFSYTLSWEMMRFRTDSSISPVFQAITRGGMLLASKYSANKIKPGLNMNAKVEKKIDGLSVTANPIFKGGILPAYWACVINEQVLPQTFSSASDVFRFVKNNRRA